MIVTICAVFIEADIAGNMECNMQLENYISLNCYFKMNGRL